MALIPIDRPGLTAFCGKHGIRRLALFGSAARGEDQPDSDVDILVEFMPGQVPGLLGIARLEIELSAFFSGRKIDLRTPEDLSRYFRDEVVREADVIYAQT
jgi:hypothetical protein